MFMKSLTKCPVLVFAFAGMLALSVTACSYSSESSSTLETSVTDGDGNTTTTTKTTTTTDGNTKTETTQTSDSDPSYVNDHFKVAYRTPAGMSKADMQPENDYEEIDYCVANGDDSKVAVILAKGVTDIDGITDAKSWGAAYADAVEESMKKAGETDIKRSVDDATIGTTPAAFVHFESKSGDKTMYRDYFFMLDSDGDGMRIYLSADSEDGLATLRDGLAGPEA